MCAVDQALDRCLRRSHHRFRKDLKKSGVERYCMAMRGSSDEGYGSAPRGDQRK